MSDQAIRVEITEDPDDRPAPGEARQPPLSDPILDPPPMHDPYAHGTGAPPPPPPGSGPGGFPYDFATPRRPPSQGKRRGPADRRLHDRIAQTYATVGIVVCAAAATRAQMIGTQDPIGATISPDRERARRANALLNQAGMHTVNMAPAAADAWMDAADEIPAIKKALNGFADGGAIAGLVMVHALMLVPYGVATGIIPEAIGANVAQMGAMMGAAAENGDG